MNKILLLSAILLSSCGPNPETVLKKPTPPVNIEQKVAAHTAFRERQQLGLAKSFYTVEYDEHKWIVFTAGEDFERGSHVGYSRPYLFQHHPSCPCLKEK
jgi:hypothetical protein